MTAGATKNEVALIVGGGPGVSSSCAKRFCREGMQVAVAARKPDKPALVELEKEHGIHRFPCDAADAESVAALLKGFPRSAAFAMACHAKAGLAQSMARELGPQGIHVAQIPIDAAIGNTLADGTRAHWVGGPTEDDNMADPDHIAETYLHLHRQHRSTWAFEIALRPWKERW